jgi:hypothetical protein
MMMMVMLVMMIWIFVVRRRGAFTQRWILRNLKEIILVVVDRKKLIKTHPSLSI